MPFKKHPVFLKSVQKEVSMSTRPAQYFCVHSHFYLPPRGNPVTGDTGTEPDAGSYRNWNERITAESYRPNAENGNFERISFDVGSALLSWLRKRAPETYALIVAAGKNKTNPKKLGNAVATTYNEVLMPLRRRHDKRTELYWGRESYRYHFGQEPMGIWLPEMAVDEETLEMASLMGYQYTILSQRQIVEPVDNGGPYWIDLPNGKKIAAFIRNEALSNDLSFNIASVGGAGHWARSKLGARRSAKNRLTLVATDGETYGHHHLGEEQFLRWLLEHEAIAMGYTVTTLNDYITATPPQETVTIKPFSSWSDHFTVTGWLAGHGAWKSMLLRACDHLAADMIDLYRDMLNPTDLDPSRLREDYIRVWLGQATPQALLADHITGLDSDTETRILALLKAQMHVARCYTSNAYFVHGPDDPAVRYVVANAAYAIKLVAETTGVDFSLGFRNDMRLVINQEGTEEGASIYDAVVAEYLTPPEEESPTSQPS
jgi:alpha-amylase/alpha-mannosidase (GH57 family)